LKAAVLFEIFE